MPALAGTLVNILVILVLLSVAALQMITVQRMVLMVMFIS